MLFKFIIILSLGPSIVAVLIFEIMLSGCAMFNHGYLRLPEKVDTLLRKLLATADSNALITPFVKMKPTAILDLTYPSRTDYSEPTLQNPRKATKTCQ
jgi:hypothetical protein